MLNIKIAKEKDKAQGYWLSLPADNEQRFKVLRKLDEGEPVGKTIAICITGVESSVPNLKQYIREHDSIEQLSILAARIEKMTAIDADIFSGALDMEAINGLEDVMRIANKLRDYKLFPDVATPKELGVYLVESGEVKIHKSAWPYLDYERVAAEYESNHAGTYSKRGYVVKADGRTGQTIAGEKPTIKLGKMQMDNNKLQTVYIDKLNQDVLPDIDFKKLHESCQSQDKQYAQEVLKSLHDVFWEIYKTDYLSADEYEFVMVPAVIKAGKTGEVSIGIITLDIGSSGEHWGTIFFTDKGLIDDYDRNLSDAAKDYIHQNYIPYEYWYTVEVERDHHVDFENAPEEICAMLDYCRPSQNNLQMNEPR